MNGIESPKADLNIETMVGAGWFGYLALGVASTQHHTY